MCERRVIGAEKNARLYSIARIASNHVQRPFGAVNGGKREAAFTHGANVATQ